MPNTQPPPSRRVQIEQYSPVLTFAKNDIASNNKGVFYKCAASNVTKVQNNQSVQTNACNNGGPDENTAWVKLGDSTVVDLSQPVFATSFNSNLNFKIGDYYADSTQMKVFKCIGNDPNQV
jgi:hypothetical protein